MKNRVFSRVLRPLGLPVITIFSLSAALNAALWILAFIAFPQQGPAAILHYNAIVGIDFIGAGTQIYILPVLGLIVLLGNGVLGLVVGSASTRARAVLWSSILVIQCILALSFGILWQLNR